MFDRVQAIELIKVVTITGELNQKIESSRTSSAVYADLSSVTRAEFFAAGSMGLKPSLVATIYSFEYNDEKIVKIGNKLYSVYRTYQRVENDKIELYLEEREGTANEPSPSSSAT